MDDPSRYCCQDSECPAYGERGAGNRTVCHRYDPSMSRCMLRCRACKARLSERTGTPLSGSYLPDETAVAVMHHLAEGVGVRTVGRLVGVRKAGRLVGVHRETVARYGR